MYMHLLNDKMQLSYVGKEHETIWGYSMIGILLES